jgi:hypothetical protein
LKVKIHKTYRDVVSICDSDLVGKTFQEGDFQLDVKENFYNGEEVDEKKLFKIINNMSIEDSTFNIIGKESTQTALKAGIISKEGIKKIQDIPFSLVLL